MNSSTATSRAGTHLSWARPLNRSERTAPCPRGSRNASTGSRARTYAPPRLTGSSSGRRVGAQGAPRPDVRHRSRRALPGPITGGMNGWWTRRSPSCVEGRYVVGEQLTPVDEGCYLVGEPGALAGARSLKLDQQRRRGRRTSVPGRPATRYRVSAFSAAPHLNATLRDTICGSPSLARIAWLSHVMNAPPASPPVN